MGYRDINQLEKITVCGTGAGGLATATTLAQKGREVTLLSLENPDAAQVLLDRQSFHVTEMQRDFNQKVRVTTDVDTAFCNTDAVAIVAPAKARRNYLETAAQKTNGDTPIVLVPGGLGVGLSCSDTVRNRGWLETNQLPFVARLSDRDRLHLHYRLPHLWAGAYSSSNTAYARDLIEN